MTTWSPPDAGDPFVGLDRPIPETGEDSSRRAARAAPGLLAPVPPSALGHRRRWSSWSS